jgi:hypothetical protein
MSPAKSLASARFAPFKCTGINIACLLANRFAGRIDCIGSRPASYLKIGKSGPQIDSTMVTFVDSKEGTRKEERIEPKTDVTRGCRAAQTDEIAAPLPDLFEPRGGPHLR